MGKDRAIDSDSVVQRAAQGLQVPRKGVGEGFSGKMLSKLNPEDHMDSSPAQTWSAMPGARCHLSAQDQPLGHSVLASVPSTTSLSGQAWATEPSRGRPRGALTSRHQVLPQHWHPEVAGQRGQVGPYAGELLAHFCGLCAEIAEGTQAHDAVGVVSKDVVPGGHQVVCLHQLQGKTRVMPAEGYWDTPRRWGKDPGRPPPCDSAQLS